MDGDRDSIQGHPDSQNLESSCGHFEASPIKLSASVSGCPLLPGVVMYCVNLLLMFMANWMSLLGERRK